MDDSSIAVLMGWLGRGWALVPLHDVSAGVCSCRLGALCGSSAGKHPRYARWQEPAQLIRDAATLHAVHAAHPEWNWGVATGAASGMWALDWDVDHDAEILAWLHSLGKVGYDHPDPFHGTLTLGPTGGGGRHYVFELPPWGEPHGSQTRNRYGLPPGLDVRGHHGQIVVAPSVSGKGPYGAVLYGDRPQRAPAWLEEMVRPQPDTQPVEKVSAGVPDSAGHLDRRTAAYAEALVCGVLAEMRTARAGERDDITIKSVYRLIEAGNAGWYTLEHLEAWFVDARLSVADPGRERGVEAKLHDQWRRGVQHVGGAAAQVPPDYAGAEHIPILDFPASPVPAGASPGGGLPFVDPGGVAGGVAPAPPGGYPPSIDDLVNELIGKMLTPEDIRALPKPQPLIHGLLDLRTTAWLIGRPKSCKSFVALDFAAHVGLGLPWQGRRVHQGLVIYIVAEGSQGIGLRLDAWEREYGPMKDLLVLPEPVPANERSGKYGPDVLGRWTVLVETCRRLQPVLVIIDTQARVTAGLKENDNDDMSYYAAQADRIKEASGACVLTVHHIGRSGTDARGASAIDGAQDAELKVERAEDAMVITLKVDAQKDMAAGKPLELGLRRSEGGVDPETGRDLSSLVIAPEAAWTELPMLDPGDPAWKRRAIALYRLIEDRYNAGAGGTEAEIKKAFKALPEVASLRSEDGRDKAWTRAWNGTSTAPGLVPRGLVARQAGAARFKIIVLEDQSADGVLTPNDLKNPTLPPEGWNLYLPDQSPRA